MTSPKSMTRGTAERREHGVVERGARARRRRTGCETWSSMPPFCRCSNSFAPSANLQPWSCRTIHHPDPGRRDHPPDARRSAGSCSPARSTASSPSGCAPSCSCSTPSTPTSPSRSTSTRPAARSTPASRSTTRCRRCRCEVATVCMGFAASMAQFLLVRRRARQAVGVRAQPHPHAPTARAGAGLRGRHRDPGRAVRDRAPHDRRAHAQHTAARTSTVCSTTATATAGSRPRRLSATAHAA